ncbi:MAG TPA: hypothetical protein ENJ08_06130 [Gammaproteobacteria bacterium]|nr:hypothetical protein [Gammaproteobacteria bacterium]
MPLIAQIQQKINGNKVLSEQLCHNDVVYFKVFPVITPTPFFNWLTMVVFIVILSLIAGMSGIGAGPGRIESGVYDWENVAVLFPFVVLVVFLVNVKRKFVWGLRVKISRDSMLVPKELISAREDKKIYFKNIKEMFVRRATFGIKAEFARYIYTKLVITLDTGEKIAIPRVNMPIMAELVDYVVKQYQTPIRFGSMLIAMLIGWAFALVIAGIIGYKIFQMS